MSLSPRLSRLTSFAASTLVAAVGLAACVEDPTELYSDEGELVGGTATAARPEIGTYFNGVNGSCTATLIGPRAVLTAAHCLSPQYTATTVPAGAVFMFTDRTGQPRNYTVDRVHSFATKRFEMVPNQPFTTDLAVLHLATAVPLTQAVPAATAIQEPYSGDLSTIFGFGCTDRTPQSGGGFKQFFSFTYPNGTNALCWGDSGGPVVSGTQTQGGAVWGVNSDFSWGLTPWDADSWGDLFADVPFYRKQLEAVVRAWDGGQEQGVDRPGLDYANAFAANANVCTSQCQNDAACRAYTYVPASSGGRCWLKSGVPEPIPSTTPGVVSGIPGRLEQTFNRAGGDYSIVSTASADQCAAACGRDGTCAAFTFQTGTCRLKSSISPVTYCGNCTSGVPRRGLELGINRPGYDLATHTSSSARQCADLCAQNDRCEAYTHTSAATNNCFLKDAVPAAGVATGMTSGVRRGLEINTNRAGLDYRSFGHAPSPTICQAQCAREAPCQAWTYVPPPTDGNNATCWLKTGVPSPSAGAGMVSGVKGLEMVN